MADRWEEVSTWFGRVCDLPLREGERLLERECRNEDVRREVLELLRSGEAAGATVTPSESFRDALGLGSGDEPTEVGPYRLEGRVGEGGMGSVWRAVRADGRFEQTVAVKIVKRGLDTDDVVRRFRRERQLLADLDHPHVARLLDGGRTADGRPYLVMEYVDGESIDVWCRVRETSVADRVKLIVAVARAVQVAHDRGVVHRDLKPTNVLVKDDGTPKLLDFGIAKLLGDGGPEASLVTQTGKRVLTPRYAAPEQVRGQEVSPATDVYALGVLLYELLTGRPLHDLRGTSAMELERAICLDDATRPSLAAPREVRTSLKGDLDLIVLRALSKEPGRRYRTAVDFADDLERHLAGLSILARPDTLTYRVGKFVRRNRLLVAATLVVIVALAAGLAVALEQYRAAEAAREDAEEQRDEAEFRTYVASLAAADALIQSGRTGNARRQLEDAPAALRGWEHDFLANAADRSLWRVEIGRDVHNAAISPDGRFVALGAQGKVPLLDARTGDTLRTLGHGTHRIRALAISPDSTRVVAGTSAGVVRVWDVESGELLLEVEDPGDRPKHDEVMAAAWSPDARWLATVRSSGRVVLRDAASLEIVERIAVERCRPHDLAFHPTEPVLAVGSGHGEIVLQRFEPVEAPRRLLTPGPAYFARWSEDGTRVAATADTKDRVVWFDAETGTFLREVEAREGLKTVGLSEDAALAASWYDRSTIHVYDAWSGASVGTCTGAEEMHNVLERITFDPNGGRLVIASRSHVVSLWDVDGAPNEWSLESLDASVWAVAVSPDGRRVASASQSGRIHLFCAPAGVHGGVLRGPRGKIDALAFDPTSSLLASASRRGTVQVWDLAAGEATWTWGTPEQPARAVAWSPDGARLLWAGDAGVVEVRDVATGALVGTWERDGAPILDLALSPDGRTLASGGGRAAEDAAVEGVVRLRDMETGRVVRELHGHDQVVRRVAWSPDGRLVAAAGNTASDPVKIWDAATGALLPMGPFDHGGLAQDLAWLAPGRLLVAGSDDTVRLYDVARQVELLVFRGMRGGVDALAVAPGGDWFVAIGASELRLFHRGKPADQRAAHVVQRLARRHVRTSALRAAVLGDPSLDVAERADALAMVDVLVDDPSDWVRRALKALRGQATASPQASLDMCHLYGLAAAEAARGDAVNGAWGDFVAAFAQYRRGEHEAALVHLDAAGLADAPWGEGRLDDAGLRSLILVGLGREEEGEAVFAAADRVLAEAPEDVRPRPSTSVLREAARHWKGRGRPAEDAP